jgi:hypothetical protein
VKEQVPKEKGSNRKASPLTVKDNQPQPVSRKLTSEEAATIVRNRLANRPVIVWRYRNGKYNMRFIITLAIMFVALIAALYFISRPY